MKFMLTRDSVCAGDDIDAPHEEVKIINETGNFRLVIESLCRGYVDNHYPEQIWVCILNGVSVAAFSRSKSIINESASQLRDQNSVHFRYIWNREGLKIESLVPMPHISYSIRQEDASGQDSSVR